MKIEKFLKASPMFQAYLLQEHFFVPLQKKIKIEGLSFIQSLALSAIYFESSPVYPTNLAKILKTSGSNMSHAISYLVDCGWVQRVSDKKDARKTKLILTPAGTKKVMKLIVFFDSIQQQTENQMGEKNLVFWSKKCEQLLSLSI